MEFTKDRECVFIHYSTLNYIPYHVQLYINELSIYFDRVKVFTNDRPVHERPIHLNENVSIIYEKNEGYDLGFFYKYYRSLNQKFPSQIACVNDSNLLVSNLSQIVDSIRNKQYDFWGIVDSNEKPWFSTHENNYHIQSHFMVFNTRAIQKLGYYFEMINVEEMFLIQDPKSLRRKVINDWEIGLTQFFKAQNLSILSFIDSQDLIAKAGKSKFKNVTHEMCEELLEIGYPLMKKKITLGKRNFFNRRKKPYWENLIRNYANPEWGIELIVDELKELSK